MPKAWDRTANGTSDCTSTEKDCASVYSYLDGQSKSMSSWASSPVWSIVDGPWKLRSFSPDGNSAFVPNKAYSGPVKAMLTEFKEVPFTTESAEYNVLQAGGNQIDVGYLPTTDAPAKPAGQDVGSNPVSGYILSPLYLWSINYFPVNQQSTSGNGPIDKQVYFRQALQYLVNQASVISGPLHGYGYPTVGPVGTFPAKRLYNIPGQPPDLSSPPPGCKFAPRCRYANDQCKNIEPDITGFGSSHEYRCCFPVGTSTGPRQPQPSQPSQPSVSMAPSIPLERVNGAIGTLLQLDGLVKNYSVTSGAVLQRKVGEMSAVADVSFSVPKGTTFGLVGESGCGKTTIGRLIVGLEKPSGGAIAFDGDELPGCQASSVPRRCS
jgi:oligopeptide/dipeptide ABC transporter ATP-binding protein